MSNTKVAICLFKPKIIDFSTSEIFGKTKLEKLNTIPASTEVALFVKKSVPSRPEWVDIISKFSGINFMEFQTSSSGAILCIKSDSRIMACCFGTSVAYINRDNIETDFGLGVVFKQIPENKIKSIESFALSNNPITNVRNSTLPTSRLSFNLDRDLENIIELSGYIRKDKKNMRVKGKEFYSVASPTVLEKIIEICRTSLSDYNYSIVDSRFQALTSIRKVKDKQEVDKLDAELCNNLNKNPEKVFINDYESFDDLKEYKLTPKGKGFDELAVDDLNFSQNIPTLASLKNRKIYPQNDNNEDLAAWSLYKCLFTEKESEKHNLILYKGIWYEIDKSYLSTLRTNITGYETTSDLPKWNGKVNEGDYNIAAASHIKGQCWDKKLYTCKEYNYGIEFCDILLNNTLFHVKKYKDSALSSHVLMQTAVSAQLLKEDKDIKKWMNDTCNKEFKKVNQLLDKKLEFKNKNETVFHIILMCPNKNKSVANLLPFFSLISFNMAIKQIIQLGYTVKVSAV
jgi:uncharacterized protein (TIGR04141 family)